MKTKNTIVPTRFDLVVTRHRPLVEYLISEGHIDADTPVVEHAHAEREGAFVQRTGDGWRVLADRRMLRCFDIPDSLDGHEERLHASDDRRHAAVRFASAHNAANVRGKHVIGVLPHHLSCHAASITEVQLDWRSADERAAFAGQDMPVDAVARAARGLHTYVVRRAEAQHMHSLAVEAAWRYVDRHGTSFGAGPGIVKRAECESVRGLEVTMIGSGCEQAHAQVIMSRGLWRPQSKGPWLDGLGREIAVEDIAPAAGYSARYNAGGMPPGFGALETNNAVEVLRGALARMDAEDE